MSSWLLALRTSSQVPAVLLVINIRNLLINLREELLFLYIFITYMRGTPPRQYLTFYSKA